MGSYGMFLEAFSRTRGQPYDYYIFSEDDYIPIRAHFDVALVRMYQATFGARDRGFLTGVLQGRPVDSRSKYLLHPESSAVVSGRSLEHLFQHTFDKQGWNGSMIDRCFHLLAKGPLEVGNVPAPGHFDKIQVGWGALMRDARIPMKDWGRAYRVPYWKHDHCNEWTGVSYNFSVPVERVLFAPTQWLFSAEFELCCVTDCTVKGFRSFYKSGSVLDCDAVRKPSDKAHTFWDRLLPSRTNENARVCCHAAPPPHAQDLAVRAKHSVPDSAFDVQEAHAAMKVTTVGGIWGRSGRQACTLSGASIVDLRDGVESPPIVTSRHSIAQAEYGLY